MKRNINFYIGAFLITLIGSAATLTIVRTSSEVSGYAGAGAEGTDVPTLEEALNP